MTAALTPNRSLSRRPCRANRCRWLAALLLVSGLPGCFSPMALDHVTLAYNEATADVISKQLLLNIARSRFNQPIFFSGISNIAATLNFQANMGMTPALAGNSGSTLVPIFGGSVSENPTISIVPIEGEQFTQRLLTPLSEDKLTLLLRQNIDIDILLRLVTLEFRTQNDVAVYHNRPRNEQDYAAFRRIVLHLSSIQDRDQLFAEPLVFERHWTLPAASVTGESFHTLEKEYAMTLDAQQSVYHLSKQVIGRTILTNYDPFLLTNAQRMQMNDEAERNAPNDFLVDIRPGYPGGEYPLHGKFRLRSFSNIMYFIGRSIANEPERDVPKDPRTPAVAENPVSVIAISESDSPPKGADVSVNYRGKYYAVSPSPQSSWNQTAFRVLSQIYQMTTTDLPKSGIPSITIAK
ncbi:hypothetical protein [Methylovulum psychrotolerans]|jgi:hypothetical protein|uniref:Uncharacterized protein n=2 Tax=Methylovulum psychrotolerans TaxID=1704499 RepID=A0A2S5CNY9_9GAMM|nr:hypothetical protein [Methylovulum psychrotolerans]POZ52535.1 hypothetical protein AADEFJLK_02020 [Methylovulum psychrotolerans]